MEQILSDQDKEHIANLVKSGGPGVEAIQRGLAATIAELLDIRGIDLKGNVGLQTCSRREAAEILERVYAEMFEGFTPDRPQRNVAGRSQWA